MKRKIISLFTLVITICAVFSSCTAPSAERKYSASSMEYFDTVITVVGYESSREEFDIVYDYILDQFQEFHKLYTIYKGFENTVNLYSINASAGEGSRTFTVDKRIVELLQFAKEMYTATGERVNVAMGSVLSMWHNCRNEALSDPENARLPALDMLEKADEHTDISNLSINFSNSTVTLEDPQMMLDVGAVAKGYATECIAKSLEERGITGYILNVGGNIRAIGTKPDGELWTIGIENPRGEGYFAYLEIRDMSVATSGSYQRFFHVGSQQYHHIIDPDTLMPADGFLSVTVVCQDSGLGDALSTALFCLSLDDGIELIEALPDTEAMWVTEEGEKTVSSGFDNYLIK